MKNLAVGVRYFFAIVSLFVDIRSLSAPPGHMKPLGWHRASSGGLQTIGNVFPRAGVFYKFFIKVSKPLHFADVLNKENHAAFANWTDDYLREAYGNVMVDVEKGKKEDRELGMQTIALSKFLDIYEDEDIYMVTDVPEEMKEEVAVPKCLHCGGLEHNIRSAVLWMSNGGTKSVLHRDSMDNMNCLIDGRKDVVLIDKRYTDLITADGFKEEGSYSTVDVDKVDMYQFPKLQDIPWYNVSMQRGDCLFIPVGWFHHVRSFGPRNVAVNLWFNHLLWFNHTACEPDDNMRESTHPLSHYEMATEFEETRFHIFEQFADMETIGKAEFIKSMASKNKNGKEQLFNYIDLNNDDVLSWEEIYTVDMEDIFMNYMDILKAESLELSQSEGEDSLHDEL